MSKVPRHLFVPPEKISEAYNDVPLSIGQGQTISQPYIVALMTSLLDLRGDEVVLEIGTGSGYQAAVLAELAQRVITVERLPAMVANARELLNTLGYKNIEVKYAKDQLGWKDGAPYDAILVAAGAPKIPDSLLSQLGEGGRLVIPVGSRTQQELMKIVKREDELEISKMGGCRFVSLIASEAWNEKDPP